MTKGLKKYYNLFGIVLICAFANQIQAQNLLNDPSFELGNLSTHWSPTNQAYISTDAPNCGPNNVWFGTPSGAIVQNVSGSEVEAGCDYTIDFQAMRYSVGTGWAGLSMTFFDASWNQLTNQFKDVNLANWNSYSMQMTAPAGTTYISIWIGNGGGSTFRIDCLELTKSCTSSCAANPGIIQENGINCPSNDPNNITSIHDATSSCNALINGEFNNGLANWALYDHSTAAASMSLDTNGELSGPNSCFIDVQSITGTTWHIEFSNSPYSVTANTSHQVSFEAKAVANRPLYVSLQLREAPWTTYWSTTVNLTTAAQIFTINGINLGVTNSNIGVMFKVGNNIEDLWIDNVSFAEEGCSSGSIEYVWEKRHDNGSGGWSPWETIPASDNPEHDPPVIVHDMQYRRKAKPSGCNVWTESNTVSINLCPEEICSNGVDDDNDGLTDCQDPDCTGSLYCKLDCAAQVTVETYAASCSGNQIVLTLPSTTSVIETTVEVNYKGCDPGDYIYVQSSIGTLILDKISTLGDTHLYRKTVNGPVNNFVAAQDCGSCNGSAGIQSLLATIIKNEDGNVNYLNQTINTEGYCNQENVILTIPTASGSRNIKVQVPLTGLTDDGRYLTVTASSNIGSATVGQTIYGPDLSLGSCCFALIDLNLIDVPANATAINLSIVTDGANNPAGTGACGQSWTGAGTIIVEAACDCPVTNVSAGPDQTICLGESVTLSASGTNSYLWNSGSNASSITVSPFTTTTFTVYGWDDEWCIYSDEVTVTVEPVDCIIPADITISCNDSTDPSNTGEASVCDYYQMSYNDQVTNNCPRIIERTWTTTNTLSRITTRTVTNQGSGPCNTGSKAFWLNNDLGTGLNIARLYDITNGVFEEYDNGTARLTGTLTNKYDSSLGFTLDCTFYGRINYADPWQYKSNESFCDAYTLDVSDWYFYTQISGQLIGTGGFSGAEIEIGLFNFFFGVGTGANLFENTYGAAAWLTTEVISEPSNGLYVLDNCNSGSNFNCADFNLNLSGEYMDIVTSPSNPAVRVTCEGTQVITIDCNPTMTLTGNPNPICIGETVTLEANVVDGLNPINYQWNEGLGNNNQHSVTPTTNTNYAVTIEDDAGCTASANIIIDVISNFTNAGEIEAEEIFCGEYDPLEIIEIIAPSGNIGGTTEFVWQARTQLCQLGIWSDWQNIASATNVNYDPGIINKTTEYRRGVRSDACFEFIYTNTTLKKVTSNIVDAGNISSNQEGCNQLDPTILTGTLPSGGCAGDITYQWQSRIPNGTWEDIANATQLDYDPPSLTASREYRRMVKRGNCSEIASNTILITIHIETINNVLKTSDQDCDGGCTGSFTIELNANTTGDFNVSYTTNGNNVQVGPFSGPGPISISDLCTGSFSNIQVHMIESGCVLDWSENISINETGAEWEHVTHTDDISDCSGVCNGAFTVDANYGLTGEFNISYTYDGIITTLGPYAFAGDILIDDLCEGIYSDITITSVESGCIDVWADDIVIDIPLPEVSINQIQDDECQENEGEVIIHVSGGSYPYTIAWSETNGNNADSGNLNVPGSYTINGLEGGNTYCITVTDSNGCTIN